MPERYRVRYARDAQEVLSELQKFVDYVKSGPVIAILPTTLQDISSDDADQVVEWQRQIEHVRRKACPMGAIAGFWLDLLAEMFTGARHRLDELGATARDAWSMESGVSRPLGLVFSRQQQANGTEVLNGAKDEGRGRA